MLPLLNQLGKVIETAEIETAEQGKGRVRHGGLPFVWLQVDTGSGHARLGTSPSTHRNGSRAATTGASRVLPFPSGSPKHRTQATRLFTASPYPELGLGEFTREINAFVEECSIQARSFAWVATAESILTKIEHLCKAISRTLHQVATHRTSVVEHGVLIYTGFNALHEENLLEIALLPSV